MTYYNYSQLKTTFNDTLDRYRKWQETSDKPDASFLNYMRAHRTDLEDLGNLWENALESGGDGIEGNTVTFQKFTEENNVMMFQTQGGEVIKMDFNSGNVSQMDNEEYAAQFDVHEMDNVNFGFDESRIMEYSFTGLEDGKADRVKSDANNYTYQELDMIDNQVGIKKIANEFVKENGDFINFQQIFGNESGKQHNVIFNPEGDSMCVIQQERAFVCSYDEEKGMMIDEINIGNVDKYTQVDTTKTIKNIKFSISDGKTLKIDITYVDPSTGANEANGANGGQTGPTGPANGGQTGQSGGWGDPHFSYNGEQAFDLQGAGGGSTGWYKTLEGDKVSLESHFVKDQEGANGATVMGEQHLSMRTQNGLIEVFYQQDGSYSVKFNGETINDPSAQGVNITKNGKEVTVNFEDRDFKFNGTDIQTNKIKNGDKGILTQTKNALNGTAELNKGNMNQVMVYSEGVAISSAVAIINGDNEYTTELAKGFIQTVEQWGVGHLHSVMRGASFELGTKPNLDYSTNPSSINGTVQEKAELFARLAYSAMSDPNCPNNIKTKVIANWLKLSSEAMMADLKDNKDSISSNFTQGHGYSRSQWNEYMGTVAFASQADIDKDGTEDKALDIDGDGHTDGFDVNHDGRISEDERLRINLGDTFKSKETGYFEF